MNEKYPATQTVHWPSGPVDACDEHARQLLDGAKFLGSHVVASKAAPGSQCGNCINVAGLDMSPDREKFREKDKS